MRICGACDLSVRHAKSPARGDRGRECPRWGAVHRACCAGEPCSETDAAGHVRCAWERGGRERVPPEALPPRGN